MFNEKRNVSVNHFHFSFFVYSVSHYETQEKSLSHYETEGRRTQNVSKIKAKVRIDGKLSDVRWLVRVLDHISFIELDNLSEPMLNRGTNNQYRVFVNIRKKKEKENTYE